MKLGRCVSEKTAKNGKHFVLFWKLFNSYKLSEIRCIVSIMVYCIKYQLNFILDQFPGANFR